MITAERVALAKYDELSERFDSGDFYTHGFYRRPVEAQGWKLSPTLNTIDRLGSILAHGILPPDVAHDLDIPIRKNYNLFQSGNTHISLYDYIQNPLDAALAMARRSIGGNRKLRHLVQSNFELLALAIRPTLPMSDKRDPIIGSAGFYPQIPSSDFLALAVEIGDGRSIYRKTLPYRRISPARLQDLVGTMTDVYKDTPELAIPIVSRRNKLLWPKLKN